MSLVPWPSQVADLARLREADFTGLLAIEPGGGKTMLASMALQEVNPRVALIIAPNSTIDNPLAAWPKTVLDVCGRDVRVIGNKNKREKQALFDFEFGIEGVYAVTPQLFTRQSTRIYEWEGDFLISDESHGLTTANKTGQRKWSGYDAHRDDPINMRFIHRLALSGTPMRQDFANMWATMRFLWPELSQRDQVAYRNHYMWMQDRMTSKQVYTSNKDRDGNFKKVTQYLAETEPGRLVNEAPLAIVHRRREECCEFHPNGFMSTEAPNVIEIEVELTPKQVKAIHELETHMMTYLEENPLITEMSMIQKMRVKQLCLGEALSETYLGMKDGEEVEKTRIEFDTNCKSPFMDATFDILDNLPRDEPVLILLESQRFAKVVVEKLLRKSIPAREYSGKTKADLNKFGVDYRVLVGVIAALGTGTNGLQDNCNTEIYLETPGSLTAQEQVFARLDRPGGKQVQRYVIHDTLGYSRGRYSALLEKQLHVNASLKVDSQTDSE